MYPGADYGRVYPEAAGANQEYMQGIDPKWTQLATMYGFRPNPYPAAGTEGQDQMRFLATLKQIADSQLGGPNGPYAKISPNDPFAALPFGLNQYMTSMAPLFQSDQGRNLMPMTNQTMHAGGYGFGGLDTQTESPLIKMLRERRAGGAVGGTPYAGGPATPTAGAAPGTVEGQAGQVSGGNTPAQTPPPAAEIPSPSTAQADIIEGLKQQGNGLPPGVEGPPVPANVSTPGVSTDRKEARSAGINTTQGVPAPLQQVWQDYMKYREGLQQQGQSQELNAWTGDIAKGFANWLGERFGRTAQK